MPGNPEQPVQAVPVLEAGVAIAAKGSRSRCTSTCNAPSGRPATAFRCLLQPAGRPEQLCMLLQLSPCQRAHAWHCQINRHLVRPQQCGNASNLKVVTAKRCTCPSEPVPPTARSHLYDAESFGRPDADYLEAKHGPIVRSDEVLVAPEHLCLHLLPLDRACTCAIICSGMTTASCDAWCRIGVCCGLLH